MKTILPIILSAFLITFSVNAQIPPEAFNYSAVARDADGEPIANQSIGIQISILEGDDETLVYQETHVAETDEFGLLNLGIGNGTIQQGDMSSIAWGENNYYLEVRMDVNGGDDFGEDPVGEPTQLLSVPYALYAKSAGSLDSEEEELYIGMEYQGGVIFDVYKDENGVQHGSIVSLGDLQEGIEAVWGFAGQAVEGSNSVWDGQSNSLDIEDAGGLATDAAGVCRNFSAEGFDDWYLPGIQQLQTLWNNYHHVGPALLNAGGSEIQLKYYWSSTETMNTTDLAWIFGFNGGGSQTGDKANTYPIRAVRDF